MHDTLATSAFRVAELDLIAKGALVATCRLEMPSGLILGCLVFKRKDDPSQLFVTPKSERLPTGGYSDIVTFSSKSREQAWQEMALAAVKPRLEAAIRQASRAGKTESYGDF